MKETGVYDTVSAGSVYTEDLVAGIGDDVVAGYEPNTIIGITSFEIRFQPAISPR